MKRSLPIRTRIAACAIAATLVASGSPVIALAEVSQSDVDAARQQLDYLSMKYADVDEKLQDTYYQIDQTNQEYVSKQAESEQTKQQLEQAQDALAKSVAATYKSGGGDTLLSLVLGSSDFESFVGNVVYAQQVSDKRVEAINTVKDLKSQYDDELAALETLKAEQEQLASQQEQEAADLASRQAEQQSYVDGLSEELKAQIQAADEAAVAQGQAAAQAAQESLQDGTTTESAGQQDAASDSGASSGSGAGNGSGSSTESGSNASSSGNAGTNSGSGSASNSGSNSDSNSGSGSNSGSNSGSSSGSNSGSSSSSNSGSNSGSSSATTGSLTASQRATIVAAASSQLGLPYSHSNTPGVGWDCSGLVGYAYARAGITIGNGGWEQYYSVTQIGLAKANATSNPQPGDVVCWWGNVPGGNFERHVALYIGNGQILHANGRMVAVNSLKQWSPYTCIGPLV